VLEKRLNSLIQKRRLSREKRVESLITSRRLDIRKRHPLLLSLEGWYTTSIPEEYTDAYSKYQGSGSNLTFTRYALRHLDWTAEQAVEFGKVASVSFKFSCRHNDLLRMAESRHFVSCYRKTGTYQYMPMKFLADPDVAIVYIPDNSGKFKWRALIRLCKDKGLPCLVMYKHYGNGPREEVIRTLNALLPTYSACLLSDQDKSIYRRTEKVVYTYSRINNPIITSLIYTDVDEFPSDSNSLSIAVH
jgi:hypothetical protein